MLKHIISKIKDSRTHSKANKPMLLTLKLELTKLKKLFRKEGTSTV